MFYYKQQQPPLFPISRGTDRHSPPLDIYTKTKTAEKLFRYINSHVLPVQLSTIHSMTASGINSRLVNTKVNIG